MIRSPASSLDRAFWLNRDADGNVECVEFRDSRYHASDSLTTIYVDDTEYPTQMTVIDKKGRVYIKTAMRSNDT